MPVSTAQDADPPLSRDTLDAAPYDAFPAIAQQQRDRQERGIRDGIERWNHLSHYHEHHHSRWTKGGNRRRMDSFKVAPKSSSHNRVTRKCCQGFAGITRV